MRKWWSRIKYQGDFFEKIKWHPQDHAYYIYARYTWIPAKQAYQVENLYDQKIEMDMMVPEILQ